MNKYILYNIRNIVKSSKLKLRFKSKQKELMQKCIEKKVKLFIFNFNEKE